MQDKIYVNQNWRFREEFRETDIGELMQDGVVVELPHTVKEVPLHYFDESEYQMVSCYQNSFHAPADWEGKKVQITFEGAAHKAEVWLNGHFLGDHACGYTAFTFDLSEHLSYGEENLITVKLDSRESLNQPPFGFVVDYMTFGGLYREVYLSVSEKVFIQDIYHSTFLNRVSTEGLSFEAIKQLRVPAKLVTEIYLSEGALSVKAEGRLRIAQKMDGKELVISYVRPGDDCPYADFTEVHLWDVESPYLYRVTTELYVDDELAYSVENMVGFRDAQFRQEGFYLNGRRLQLRGLNRHQSFPYVGYAMPESMQREDARILKNELGVNVVRTSHYPQSRYFLDECDRLGLLVVTEIPGWQHIGDDDWKAQALINVRDMILQCRNHPSIILWGVRINESKDCDSFYEKTNVLAWNLDQVRQTCGVRCMTADAHTVIHEDVFTYNDFHHNGTNAGCIKKKKATHGAKKPYLVTEHNGHMFPTKSADPEEHRVSHMLRHGRVMNDVNAQGDIAGAIGWCMFDYNTHKDFGSGDRICYHGVMDMFRNPKLVATLYAAQGSKDTVLEVSSSMDIGEHPACNRGDIYILTNADSVKMYKNGHFLKEYFAKDSIFPALPHGPLRVDDYIGNTIAEGEKDWSAKKAALAKKVLNGYSLSGGKITADMIWPAIQLLTVQGLKLADAVPLFQKYVGDWGGASKEYEFEAIKDGEVVKTIKRGAVTKIGWKIKVSHRTLTIGSTYDVAALRVYAVDRDGNVLPYYGEPFRVETEGPIQLMGPDMLAFSGGMSGLYVKTTGETGDAAVTLKSATLGERTICLKVVF